ncbi:MAG: SAM-dependent methyltransferase [Planctomycetes bacterium]|nr:SAM-dependent methyltransferase [Planctomycetota bacterium]
MLRAEPRVLCRGCDAPLTNTLADLGVHPSANAYLTEDQLAEEERLRPLHARVCGNCYLVQIATVWSQDELFDDDYAYFSSFSDSWLDHAARLVDDLIAERGLGPDSKVVEIASNDGYLLRNVIARGIPCLGVDPCRNVAEVAIAAGIPTEVRFFGQETARDLVERGWRADVIIANNVLAHVPDIRDLVSGLRILLARDGVISLEFPHLLRMMDEGQFDTIYHEHFSYLSLTATKRLLERVGLSVFDVERLKTHGGSLRVRVGHAATSPSVRPSVSEVLAEERRAGLLRMDTYETFGARARSVRTGLRKFLEDAKARGQAVAAYGAPAKGNTLLNYCGIGRDLVSFTVDRSPRKHGRWLPGSHIPVYPVEYLKTARPDWVLILPWNLRDEIVECADFVRSWGGRFVVPIPRIEVIP